MAENQIVEEKMAGSGDGRIIGLGHIEAERGSEEYETAAGYERALSGTSISEGVAARLLLSASGKPHYKIRGRYYAPCAGDTSVFLLPDGFDRQAHLLRDKVVDEIGDLLVHDRYPDHFHVTLRGFGTMPVFEGDPDLVAARAAHKPAFRAVLEEILVDGSTSRNFKLKPHDIALLGSRSAVAVVIRHCPATDEDAAGLQRLFRAFDSVFPDGTAEAGATWHSTLAYRLTKPFTGEEATRFARCLAKLSDDVGKLPPFELSLSDLVYWVFADMDDFHEVGNQP